MSEDLSHLSINHNYFISQNKLTLLLYTFARSQWYVIPNKKLLKMVFDDNNFLIQWDQKCWWTALEDFRFTKYANLKDMVYDRWDRLDCILLWSIDIKFDQIKKLTFFLFFTSFIVGLLLSWYPFFGAK